MKAVAILGERNVALIEREKPQIHDGEVLLKIHYVGFAAQT